jgi:site-specific recombinase XerD
MFRLAEILFFSNEAGRSMRSHAGFNRKLVKRWEQWMVIQHYSVGTKYIYKQTLALFVDFLSDKSITDVTHLDVRRFLLRLSEDGVSLICARKHLVSLRRFYDFLNLGGLVTYVAPRLVAIRQTARKIPPHFSEEEMRRLISAAKTLREKALVECLYATGCRVTEMRCMKVQDLDLNARNARVTGKYGKTRVVLLTNSAAEALRLYIADRTVGYVFQQDYPVQTGILAMNKGAWIARWIDHANTRPGYTYSCKYLGSTAIVSRERAKAKFDQLVANVCLARPKPNSPLTSHSVGNILGRVARRVGLTRATAHMFRHSFATHLYENGADLMVIQTLLGHVELHSTAHYARSSAFKLIETFDRCHPLGGQREKPNEN